MEKSSGYEDTEGYLDQRDIKRKSKEKKERPVRFYHATPVTTLKAGDILEPGPGTDEVSLADSPVPHYTISEERIKPQKEYRQRRIDEGSWRRKWDGSWEVYEVEPLDQVRYHGEFEEYRAPRARIIKKVGNAGAIYENYLKRNKKGGGSKVEHMGHIHGVKVVGRGPDTNSDLGIRSYDESIARVVREMQSQEDFQGVRNQLTQINTRDKFIGPDKMPLMTGWPSEHELKILEKSETQRITKALIKSGHLEQEFNGNPEDIPIKDAVAVLRKTTKPGSHVSFTVAVWDGDKSPIPGPEEKKLIAVLRKEFPKIEIKFIFRDSINRNNTRVLKIL